MKGKDIGLILGLAVVVLLTLGLLGGMMVGPGMMGGYWGYGNGSWWGVAMPAFWILVVAGAVALVAQLRSGSRSRTTNAPGRELYSGREILRERYARGEITREQYEQIRRDLEED